MNATEPTFPVSGPPAVWIGMDIAKDTFEACLLRTSGKRGIKSFANDATGIAKLQRWVASLDEKQPCHSCMEATGNYYLAAALALAEAEQTVSVVNPFRIKHAGFTYGQGNKTDKADARTLAQFCRKEQPAPWRAAAPEVRLLTAPEVRLLTAPEVRLLTAPEVRLLTAPEVRLLTALLRRVDSLQVQHVAEQNRLQDPGLLDVVRTSIQSSLDFHPVQPGLLECRDGAAASADHRPY
jgi:transposase